jgi:hypothetical protein
MFSSANRSNSPSFVREIADALGQPRLRGRAIAFPRADTLKLAPSRSSSGDAGLCGRVVGLTAFARRAGSGGVHDLAFTGFPFLQAPANRPRTVGGENGPSDGRR